MLVGFHPFTDHSQLFLVGLGRSFVGGERRALPSSFGSFDVIGFRREIVEKLWDIGGAEPVLGKVDDAQHKVELAACDIENVARFERT